MVFLAGALGGVFEPGGDTIFAACDRVSLFVLPLFTLASCGRSPMLAACPPALNGDCAVFYRELPLTCDVVSGIIECPEPEMGMAYVQGDGGLLTIAAPTSSFSIADGLNLRDRHGNVVSLTMR